MPRSYLSCCSAATAATPATTRTSSAAVSSSSLHVTASSDTSSFSDNPSSAAFSFDDTSSLHTLPSVHSLNPPLLLPSSSSSPAASFLCLAAIPSTHSAALALTPSLHLYSASASDISIYDLSAPDPTSLISSLPSPSSAGALKSLTLSSAGHLLTAHQDGRIRVWSANNRRLIATLPTAADRLRRLPLPSSYVAVRRHKHRLRIQHHDAVSAVAAAGELIYSVSWDKTLKIWRSSDLRCLESLTAHDDAVNAVAVSGDGTVYTGSADRRIRVWTRGPGEKRHGLVATLDRHRSAVNALALGRAGSVLYSGAFDRSILVWEREESADYMVVVGALRGHTHAVLCLASIGDLVFSGSSDRTVRVWRRGEEGEGYNCLVVMEGHDRGVRSVVAAQVAVAEGDEEYRVCSGSVDGEVRVWRVRVSSLKRPGSSNVISEETKL